MKNSLRIHKWTHNEFNIFILGVLTHPHYFAKYHVILGQVSRDTFFAIFFVCLFLISLDTFLIHKLFL